jgi:4,5-DOPA dioxygenase extradiol
MATNPIQNPKSLIPVMFIAHGNPMNAIEDNQYTKTWQKLAHAMIRPKAILCISAHWETKGIAITAAPKP